MTQVVVADHLLREVLTGERPTDLGGVASSLATTGLWLSRLSSAFAARERVGKLTAPVAALQEFHQRGLCPLDPGGRHGFAPEVRPHEQMRDREQSACPRQVARGGLGIRQPQQVRW